MLYSYIIALYATIPVFGEVYNGIRKSTIIVITKVVIYFYHNIAQQGRRGLPKFGWGRDLLYVSLKTIFCKIFSS